MVERKKNCAQDLVFRVTRGREKQGERRGTREKGDEARRQEDVLPAGRQSEIAKRGVTRYSNGRRPGWMVERPQEEIRGEEKGGREVARGCEELGRKEESPGLLSSVEGCLQQEVGEVVRP